MATGFYLVKYALVVGFGVLHNRAVNIIKMAGFTFLPKNIEVILVGLYQFQAMEGKRTAARQKVYRLHHPPQVYVVR